jgi:hypothetical protein
MTRDRSAPIVVSLFSGEQYYREAEQRLRNDCTRVGIDYDIVALEARPAQDWIDICRRKVPFYLEMHHKHQRPILWLDVDSRLAARPAILDGAACDVAGFLRGLRYLRDFDPQALPRFFSPFALYFSYTPRVTAFLELMAQIESSYDGSATDDFFLHEAWKQHKDQLSVMVLPPYLVGREWPLTGEQAIYVGISGNVSKFKDQAEQHVAEALAPERRKLVLLHEAENARREGDIAGAILLYRRALAIAPDEALAQKIERLARREPAGEGEAADSPLTPTLSRKGRGGWTRWLSPRRSS